MTEHKCLKPELLLPAGSLEVLKIAFLYGADAVYIGGEAYSLRAKATNFTIREMEEGIRFAHARGKRVYVTANIFAHHQDLDGVRAYFKELSELEEQPDALLIADAGVFMLARELLPEMELHISTQANTTNEASVRFWQAQGARRVVLARELSLAEIGAIRKAVGEDVELEAFVHGAMCISYSGRCLLSNYFTGRDANKGACTHPCRWQYALVEQTRPSEYLPVTENERGTYIMNSKDLCMVAHIPELVRAGINSLKVEGRMKTALYVASAAKTYREAIDDYFTDEALYRSRIAHYEQAISEGVHRGFTTGFYFGKPKDEAYTYAKSDYVKSFTYLGYIEAVRTKEDREFYRITQKNKFCVGETIEVMTPKGDNKKARVELLLDADGHSVDAAPHPKQEIWVALSVQAQAYDILRRKEGTEKWGEV